MHLKLKKSKITDWWVAKENDKMAFVNILSGEPLRSNLKVVGYFDKGEEVVATSTNYVVMITKEGVITSQGSFYPFEEAHEVYLQFLIYANKEDTIIGYNWDFADKVSKEKIVADIIDKGSIRKDVTFDFIPNEKDVMLSGYSNNLSKNVILSTFSRRNNGCLVIFGIADFVKADIYNSSFAFLEESQERVKEVKKIFSNIVKGKNISVKVGK
ncbi:MAG: hypothetical protein IJE05_07540 [Clostridia bacterium]|nr:hypothetical protein [Clostridia bacterium]